MSPTPTRRRRRAAAADERMRAGSGEGRTAASAPHDEVTLRQAFGRYATRAAVEFSAAGEGDEDAAPDGPNKLNGARADSTKGHPADRVGDSPRDDRLSPANGNTAPSPVAGPPSGAAQAPIRRRPRRAHSRDEVVIALSDRRPERLTSSDGNGVANASLERRPRRAGGEPWTMPSRQETSAVERPVQTTATNEAANEPVPTATASASPSASAPGDVRTQVTLTRETATFEVPGFNEVPGFTSGFNPNAGFFGSPATPIITTSTAAALAPISEPVLAGIADASDVSDASDASDASAAELQDAWSNASPLALEAPTAVESANAIAAEPTPEPAPAEPAPALSALVPPPLPAWALRPAAVGGEAAVEEAAAAETFAVEEAGTGEAVGAVAPVAAEATSPQAVEAAAQPAAGLGEITTREAGRYELEPLVGEEDEARWEFTQDPFADDISFDEEDETIVTIARRLSPQTGPAE